MRMYCAYVSVSVSMSVFVCMLACCVCICIYAQHNCLVIQHTVTGMKSTDELVQLEVLYSSRGRKIDELTKQLELLQDDYEKKLRIAGHEKRQLQQQKELLLAQMQQKDDALQHLQNELNKTIANLEATRTQASTLDAMQTEVSVYKSACMIATTESHN